MPKPGGALSTRRILVVDDEPFVCDAVKLMLEFDGHTVETASHGKEALEVFQKSKFDLVITDWKMPGMSGDQLADAVKQLLPGQPVVMITAHAEMLQTSSISLKSVDAIVPKPFLLDDLRKAIAKVTPAKEAEKKQGGKKHES
jgi:CheY-like chemotaxis protein